MKLDFLTLKRAYSWKKVKGLEGKLIFTHENEEMTLKELVKNKVNIQRFDDCNSKDLVLVAKIKDGGIISYIKKDGSYSHTLNDEENFNETLKKLKISL